MSESQKIAGFVFGSGSNFVSFVSVVSVVVVVVILQYYYHDHG